MKMAEYVRFLDIQRFQIVYIYGKPVLPVC